MLSKDEIIIYLKANDEKLTEIEWHDIDDIDVEKLKEAVKNNTYCRILTIKGQEKLSIESEKLLYEIHKRVNENYRNYQIKLKQLKNSPINLSINQTSENEYFQKLLISTSNTLTIFRDTHPNIQHYIGNRGQSTWTIFKKLDKPEAKTISDIIKQRAQTNLEIIKIGVACINNFITPFGGKENHLYIPNKRIINTISEILLQPNCQLKEIHMQNCKIDSNTLGKLFKAVKDNKSVVILDLSNLLRRHSRATSIWPSIIEKYLIYPS